MRLLAEAKADGVAVDTEMRLIGGPAMFANSNEFVQAVGEMLRAVGLNVKLEMLEMSQWLEVEDRPFDPNRKPNIFLTVHDNNSGVAAFTVCFKYHSNGRQSELHNPALDAPIENAATLSGDARKVAYNEVFRMICQDILVTALAVFLINIIVDIRSPHPSQLSRPTRPEVAKGSLFCVRFCAIAMPLPLSSFC